MAYEYRYINRNRQPGSVSYSLLIEDTETKETIRIEKSFKVDFNIVDSEFLRIEAKKEIDRIIEEKYNNAVTEEMLFEDTESE
jgi:hypothetical protein